MQHIRMHHVSVALVNVLPFCIYSNMQRNDEENYKTLV